MTHGIDFGSTYAKIAKIGEHGVPVIIEDYRSASAALPSAVYFEHGGSIAVGASAKEVGLENPDRLCEDFKRWIGFDGDFSCERYVVDGIEYGPTEVAAMVLGRLKEYADMQGDAVKDVVIAVPVCFNEGQREAVKKAGRLAGMNVLATIKEPVAAATSFLHGSPPGNYRMLVYDLGGATFDLTLLDAVVREDGAVDTKILITDGNPCLGGREWDKAMFDLLQLKLSEATAIPVEKLDEDIVLLLKREAEGAKQQLSDMSETTVKIRYDGERHKLTVTRGEFEAATKHLLDKTVQAMDSCLLRQVSGKIVDKIDLVLMAGGATRMVQVQEMLGARFPGKVQFYEPDKSVAFGAAIAADRMLRSVQPPSGPAVRKKDESDKKAYTIPVREVSDYSMKRVPIAMKRDEMPVSYGFICGVGNDNCICENFIKKGDPVVDCTWSATYDMDGKGPAYIVLPIVESESMYKMEAGRRDASGQYIFIGTNFHSLRMKERARLLLNFGEDEKIGRIQVEAALTTEDGKLHVVLSAPDAGKRSEVRFSTLGGQRSSAVIYTPPAPPWETGPDEFDLFSNI